MPAGRGGRDGARRGHGRARYCQRWRSGFLVPLRDPGKTARWILNHKVGALGDASKLADPGVVDDLIEKRQKRKNG